MKMLLVTVFLVVGPVGCGSMEGDPGDWDDTCYDCRTVCEGVAAGDEQEACLAKCVECQGYSACFEWMDGRYQGMLLEVSDWKLVDCSDLIGKFINN